MAMEEEDYLAMAEELSRESMPAIPTTVSLTDPVDKPKRGRPRKERSPDDDEEDGGSGRKPALPPMLPPDEPSAEDGVLMNMIKDGEDPRHVYDRLVLEIAEEALHLKYLRMQAQASGVPFSKISRDRVAALKELSDIMTTKAKELASRGSAASGVIDFGSPEFRRVMAYVIQQVMESATAAAIPDHSIKLMASALQQRLNGFEDKAKELYGGTAASKKTAAMNAAREI